MSEWLYPALIAPALWAIVNVFDDNLLRDIYRNPLAGTVVTGLLGVLPVLGAIFYRPDALPAKIMITAMISGALIILSYWFYFAALERESPSVVVAMWYLYPALMPFFAYFVVGEILSASQYLGFVIILASSVALGFRNLAKPKAWYLMVSASVIYALAAVMHKYVFLGADFWSGFFWISVGMGATGLLMGILHPEGRAFFQRFPSYKQHVWLFFLSEGINIAAVVVSLLAISMGPVSLVSVVQGTQPFYVLFLAVVLHKRFPAYFREGAEGGRILKVALMLPLLLGLYLIT